jgi:hypothetical protein
MYKNSTKCNETLSKWCKNKHGASNIIDTFETYQASSHLVPPSESPVPLESGRAAKVCGVKPKLPLAEMGRVAGRFIRPPTGKKSGTSERGRHVRRRRDL